jgi:hypothetical protein
MTDYADRRQHPRRSYRVGLTFQFDGKMHRGEGLDLSLDGIGFHSGLDIPNGMELEFDLGLPSGDNVVNLLVRGTIRWHLEVLQGVYRYGVTFAPLDADQRGAIGCYLADMNLHNFS